MFRSAVNRRPDRLLERSELGLAPGIRVTFVVLVITIGTVVAVNHVPQPPDDQQPVKGLVTYRN
jgi:hypothetical protein